MHPIYVDVSDEVTTVIERLKGAAETEIALVIPKGAVLLQSLVNLKLVKKAARDSGKELTIVSTDKIGRNLAAQAGIANLAHLDDAPEAASEPQPETIGGVTVHRYYDEETEEQSDADLLTPVEPIIPIPLPPTAVAPEPEEDLSPIVVRDIATEPAKPSNIEIIRPSSSPAVATAVPTAATPRGRNRTLPYLAFLLLLIIVAAAAISSLYLPKTTVAISVSGQPWSKTYASTATVGQPVDATHLTTASYITASENTSVTFQATGSKDIGDQAHGTATLSYVQDSNPQTVPAGTVLTANNISFTTDQAVTVPGAKVVNAKPVAGTANVAVTAVDPGPDGNMNNVPATVQDSNTYGEIDETTGGTSQQVSVVTDTDIANAEQALQTKLQSDLQAKLSSNPANHPPTSDTAQTDSLSVSNVTPTPTAGTQASSGSVSGSGTLKRLVYDPAALDASVKALAAKEPVGDNVQLQVQKVSDSVQSTDLAHGTISFTSTASGQVVSTVNTQLIRSQITGKSVSDAEALIRSLVNDSTATVSEQPAWWPLKRIPYSDKYLTVQVKP